MRLPSAVGLGFLIFTLFSNVNALNFTDCGSKIGSFSKVIVSDCNTTESKCILKRGGSVSITIDFFLTEPVEKVTTKVFGVILSAEIPFHLDNPNACETAGLKCPLEAGENYRYHATLPVLTSYPKLSVTVKWELQDGAERNIVCVSIPAKLQ